MAQRSHVPKFGNWEGDNVPYTAYFDTAIKQKIGGVMINPNDPAQNPEAFKTFGRSEITIENENSTDTEESDSNKISGRTSHDKSASSEQYQADVEGHRRPFAHRKSTSESDQTNNSPVSTQKSNVSDSSSVFTVQHERFDPHKVTMEGNYNGFLAMPTRSNRSKASINPADDDISFTSVSVPKFGFGAFDEKDPKSGEGFSIIFKQVKEEKHIATIKLPPGQPHPQTSNTPVNQSKKSKRYCCY